MVKLVSLLKLVSLVEHVVIVGTLGLIYFNDVITSFGNYYWKSKTGQNNS